MEQEMQPVAEDTTMAKVIYVLYLVGLLFGLAALVGVIMAYVKQPATSDWLQSHYRFQIRTFWIGLLFLFIGVIGSVILIGYLVLLFWLVWVIVRCVKGLQALDKQQPVANPGSWMFG